MLPLILSSDSHVFDPPDLWQTRIDAAFRDRAKCAEISLSALDRDVEIEKDLPIVIFPHQALDPENRGEAHTARDWLHVVQARCGVNDHIPRR